MLGGAVIKILRVDSIIKVSNQSASFPEMSQENFNALIELFKKELLEEYNIEIVDHIF